MAERLALPTSVHGVAGSNPAGGEILPEPKRRFIAQSLSCSPFHRLEMTEILLKGRKTLTHPSIFTVLLLFIFRSYLSGHSLILGGNSNHILEFVRRTRVGPFLESKISEKNNKENCVFAIYTCLSVSIRLSCFQPRR